ncbi:MAG: hypothetical protein KA802_11770, partial [Saprospiraceae bacterium]|nr:hypothetical protein [Saprospiraceae bacterium]
AGHNLFLLSDSNLIRLDIESSKIDKLLEINFLKYGVSSKVELLSSSKNVGLLEYSQEECFNIKKSKHLNFYELDKNFNLLNTLSFEINPGGYLLEEDIQDLSHFMYNRDTLILSFGQGSIWEIVNGIVISENQNENLAFRKMDIITGEIYDVTYHKDTCLNRYFYRMFLRDELILDSREDYNQSDQFPLFYIADNQIYFSGEKKYRMDVNKKEWKEIQSHEFFLVYNIIKDGFYNYSPSEKSFKILYLQEQ